MEQPSSETDRWIYFCGFVALVIVLASIHWSLEHPYGTSWDEAGYLNEVLIDAQRLEHGRILSLGKRILVGSFGRPPAYRPLSLPFLVLFGLHPASARLLSVACFVLSAWFIFLATRRVGSRTSSSLAVLIFCLSPVVVSACLWLSTEGPLYLATSAMLYYVLACWTEPTSLVVNSIGLGLALGMGFLAKGSFAAIALPLLAFWLVLGGTGRLGLPSLMSQWKALALALLVAAPWWVLNFRHAFSYAQYARGFVANSLGSPSLATWSKWLETVLLCLIGPTISIFVGLVVVAFLRKVIVKKEVQIDLLRKAALGACACAGLPIVLAQLSGTNHLLRHISPALIPFAVAVGILTDFAGWERLRSISVISFGLFLAQLLMLLFPVFFPNQRPLDVGFVNGPLPWRAMVRRDQWDWTPILGIARQCGRQVPRISYLGNAPDLCPPAIAFPWVAQDVTRADTDFQIPDPVWLWRFEEGAIDWKKVMDSAAHSDMVLVAPSYAGVGKEDEIYNQHNADLADRLSEDSHFQAPMRFTVGRFQPIEVLVFLNRGLACGTTDKSPESHQLGQVSFLGH